MSAGTQRRLQNDAGSESANEALRRQWNNRLAWSTMFAVALHAAAIVLWPAWEANLWPEVDEELTGTAWIALYAAPSSGNGGGRAMASLSLLVDTDSLPAEDVGADAIVGGSEVGLASLPGRLRERLAGQDGPRPTVVQFGPAVGPRGIGDDRADSRDEEEELVPTIEEPTEEDVALLLEASPMDLSRLSAVRPQIVLRGTSAWILIRNPIEVDEFMNRGPGGQASEIEGLVDVTVWIDEWGSVEWTEISQSSGQQDMDEIALALFNEVASFRPARDQGVRVSMSAIFTVLFPW